MRELKTKKNEASPEGFIASVPDEQKRADSEQLLKLYKEVTGEQPKMWGSSVVGFGQYHYKSERSSQEGDWPRVSFSPRKANLTLYFMDGFDSHQGDLAKLGKATTSVGCLYVKKLADIDQTVLKSMIKRSLANMAKSYPA